MYFFSLHFKMNRSNYVYAVHKGRRTGLYMHWEGEGGCREQIDGFEGAVFKKFNNIPQARNFVDNGPSKQKKTPPKLQQSDYFRVPCNCNINESVEPLIVYVDGSAKKDKEGVVRGGYGIWFGEGDVKNLKEVFRLPNPTNNRCEVMGAKRAIEIVDHFGFCAKDTELIIATDSKYVIGAMKCGAEWKNGSTKNQGLLKSLYALCKGRPVAFLHVPGHKGVKGNVGADKLAKEGADLAQPTDAS